MPQERRLFLPNAPAGQPWQTGEAWRIEDAETLHHLRTVQRVKPGALLTAVDAENHRAFRCRLTAMDRHQLTLDPLECTESAAENRNTPKIILYAGVLKESGWDVTLQKATELGVDAVQPLLTRYTVALPKDAPTKKRERWQRIAREAALQSERLSIPEVGEPLTLEAALEGLNAKTNAENSLNLALVERSQNTETPALLTLLAQSQLLRYQTLTLFVGPEGGWHPDEKEALLQHPAITPAHVGRRILRAETASLIGVGLIAQMLEAERA